MGKQKENGITLIALVITIIILLILAGISISSLTQSGLFGKAKESKIVSIRAEMKERLTLAISELQIEKKGDATLDDITQEWIDESIKEYTNKVTKHETLDAKKVTMDKNGVRGRFIIDGKFNITEDTGLDFSYEIIEKNGTNVKISITVRDEENGINKIELPGKEPLVYNSVEEVRDLEYDIELGEEYIILVTTGDGETKRVKILIEPEIEVTEAYINTTQSATSSVADNSVIKGTELYINFTATLMGSDCTIEPPLTEAITKNGIYTYTITGIFNGKTITAQKHIAINKYKYAVGLVKYDAGEWTKEEIEELKSNKLYDINKEHVANEKYKLKDENGLNFTFGGFTYKGDKLNEEAIVSGTVITNKNQSVSPQSGYGVPEYDGWRILESREEDGKIYVKKIVHAGSPENFVFYMVDNDYDLADRAEYLLSNGLRKIEYNTLNQGERINPRNWEMYKDKDLESKGLIKGVHAMTCEDASFSADNVSATKIEHIIGSSYYFANSSSKRDMTLWWVNGDNATYSSSLYYTFGIRPVVEMNDGVYIAGGDGTETNPYVLGKD